MKEGRSAILIIRSLKRLHVQDTTAERVLSIILDTRKKLGEEAAEQKATELMEMVDSSKTEAELLQKLDKMK